MNVGVPLFGSVKQAIPVAATGGAPAPVPSQSKVALGTLQRNGQFPTTPIAEFARVAAYHNRKNYRGIVPSRAAGSTGSLQVDFHQIIAPARGPSRRSSGASG